MVKNLPANAGDIREAVSIPESGSFLEVGVTTHSSILAWRIPWTEEPGGLQSMGSQSRTGLGMHLRTWLIYSVVLVSALQQRESVVPVLTYVSTLS